MELLLLSKIEKCPDGFFALFSHAKVELTLCAVSYGRCFIVFLINLKYTATTAICYPFFLNDKLEFRDKFTFGRKWSHLAYYENTPRMLSLYNK